MEIAGQRLKEAGTSFKNGVYSGALILSYTAMFHAARAVLFKDGWAEKSHVCVAAYLKERYVQTEKLERRYLSMFDTGRIERHETLYGLEATTSSEDAEHVLNKAKEFVTKVAEIVRRWPSRQT